MSLMPTVSIVTTAEYLGGDITKPGTRDRGYCSCDPALRNPPGIDFPTVVYKRCLGLSDPSFNAFPLLIPLGPNSNGRKPL